MACTQAGTVCVRHKAEVICLAGEPLHNLDFETCGSSHHSASASSLVISYNTDYLPYRVPRGLCLLSILRSSVMLSRTSALDLDMCIANNYY